MKKRIINWEAGGAKYSRGFIFGNYGWSAADYALLVAEAQKDFPALTLADIEINRVAVSGYMKGFKMVAFSLPAGTEHEAYKQWDRFDFYLA